MGLHNLIKAWKNTGWNHRGLRLCSFLKLCTEYKLEKTTIMLEILPVTARSSSSSCSDKAVSHTAEPEGRASCRFLKRMTAQRYCELCLLGWGMYSTVYWGSPSVTLSFISFFLSFLALSSFSFSTISHSFLVLFLTANMEGDGEEEQRRRKSI